MCFFLVDVGGGFPSIFFSTRCFFFRTGRNSYLPFFACKNLFSFVLRLTVNNKQAMVSNNQTLTFLFDMRFRNCLSRRVFETNLCFFGRGKGSRSVFSWPLDRGKKNSDTGTWLLVGGDTNRLFFCFATHQRLDVFSQQDVLFPVCMVTASHSFLQDKQQPHTQGFFLCVGAHGSVTGC